MRTAACCVREKVTAGVGRVQEEVEVEAGVVVVEVEVGGLRRMGEMDAGDDNDCVFAMDGPLIWAMAVGTSSGDGCCPPRPDKSRAEHTAAPRSHKTRCYGASSLLCLLLVRGLRATGGQQSTELSTSVNAKCRHPCASHHAHYQNPVEKKTAVTQRGD